MSMNKFEIKVELSGNSSSYYSWSELPEFRFHKLYHFCMVNEMVNDPQGEKYEVKQYLNGIANKQGE